MDLLLKAFKGFPSQEKVVEELLRSGIRVVDGVAYCNSIKLADSALATACGVDRRVVRTTLERISADPELSALFSKMAAIALYSGISGDIGCTAFDIEPDNCRAPGTLAEITRVISDEGLSVRQAVVVNRGTEDDQHLVIVLNGEAPPEIMYLIRNCRGVKTVTLL